MALINFNKVPNTPGSNIINYNGHQLPTDKKAYVPIPPDLTNNPSLVVIGGTVLPGDVIIYLNGSKVIAVTKILDGVQVTERISRNAYEIEFECVMRTKRDVTPWDGSYIFPQDALDNLWSDIWLPDSVQTVQNTYLNKLGIQEIIIESISPGTVRGSTNLPLRIRGWENVPGTSLIISSAPTPTP